ncbi:hypothetical protein GOODEAATRI_020949, partial [Goodea atripinnis]
LRQRVRQPSETRDPIGRCYVLSDDLTRRDDLDGGEWKFCEGRPQGHEQFGFCQQGLSVSFTPDRNFILFGAPGTYNWKGEMRVELLNQTVLDLGFYDDGPYEVADHKELNALLIPVPYHSYLGRIRPQVFCRLSKGYNEPRGVDLCGWCTTCQSHRGCGAAKERQCAQTGATAHFLGRGACIFVWIFVGAPFDEDGKVFIYRGSDAGIETKPAQVLDGHDFDVKRFGYSISGGLDIDENHYPDVVVGSLNDSVVLFRSRPVIHVIREVSIDPQYIDLEQKNCKGRDGVW